MMPCWLVFLLTLLWLILHEKPSVQCFAVLFNCFGRLQGRQTLVVSNSHTVVLTYNNPVQCRCVSMMEMMNLYFKTKTFFSICHAFWGATLEYMWNWKPVKVIKKKEEENMFIWTKCLLVCCFFNYF